MKQLYTYLVEKQGYLDYRDFINDIFNQVNSNIEFKKNFWESIISYRSYPDLEMSIESDNYPYWLEKLYIKSYPELNGDAAIDTDLVFLNKDKTKS